MGGWHWKDLGIRPLVFPVVALGLGCAFPGLARSWPALAACLTALLAIAALLLRTRPGAHLALLVGAWLTGWVLARGAERSTPLPTGTAVLLEGRLASADLGDRGGRAVLEVARLDGTPARARTRLWWSDPDLHPWAGQRVQL